jgi:type IV pilus assembly protein PilW
MSLRRHSPTPRRRARGASLIEIMVGVVIGLIAVLVIYQIFTVAEGLKRNTTGAADAQQNGLLSTFTLALELNSAGNGISPAALRMIRCPTDTIEATRKPIPALIEPGASDNAPDALVVLYGTASSVTDAVETAPVGTLVAGAASLPVRSPNGFRQGDQVVLIQDAGVAPPGTTPCSVSVVSAAVPAPNLSGVVSLPIAPATPFDINSNSMVVNMGQANQTQRVRYSVASDTLQSLDLVNPAAVPVPLASNVVNMKAQYGIDNNNDGIVDTWVKADAAPFQPANLLAATHSDTNDCLVNPISCIRAFRIGLIVRSDQWDRDLATPAGDFPWVLFDCEDPVKANCPGRMTGTIVQSATGGWRYRVFETVVPLRNQVWVYSP